MIEPEIESEDEEVQLNFQGMAIRDPTPPIRNGKGDGPVPAPRGNWGKPVKVEPYAGELQSWPVWFRMFEKIAVINGWQEEKANWLFSFLRGPALEVACTLSDVELEDYNSLVDALDNQFGPTKQIELNIAELRNRRKRPTESYRELGRAIKKLSGLAYSTLNYDQRDKYAKVHFTEAITEKEIKLLVVQGKPATLDEAIKLAEEISSYRTWVNEDEDRYSGRENRHVNLVGETGENSAILESLKTTTNTMARLGTSMEKMIKEQQDRSPRRYPQTPKELRCWNCSQLGHRQADCRLPLQPGNEVRPEPRGVRRS